MEEPLASFIEDNYTIEQALDITNGFKLLETLEYSDLYTESLTILSLQGVTSTEDQIDSLVADLKNKLTSVLDRHKIYLVPEIDLDTLVKIVSCLNTITFLEEFSFIQQVLDNEAESLDQLAEILVEYTELSEVTVYDALTTVSDNTILALKNFVNNSPATQVPPEQRMQISKIVNNLRIMFDAIGTDNLAYELVKDGAEVGLEFPDYFFHIADAGSFETNQLGKNIFSMLYMTEAGQRDPLALYREYSEELIQDLDMISQVETQIIALTGKVTEYKKALVDIGDVDE